MRIKGSFFCRHSRECGNLLFEEDASELYKKIGAIVSFHTGEDKKWNANISLALYEGLFASLMRPLRLVPAGVYPDEGRAGMTENIVFYVVKMCYFLCFSTLDSHD